MRFKLGLMAGVCASAIAFPAYAQDAADATDAAAEDDTLIIVTATKRQQTLQEVPIAVSVTNAETLEREQIRDLQDLQTLVPSLRVSQLQSSANTNFIIRGFGNGANNVGIEPSVGVFVDGVFRSRTASQINDLPDVQRIEVLRGPQSTLFGKNASAGVISIVTKEPTFEPSGLVELTYGNFDAIVAKGYVSGAVSSDIAVSFAAGLNKRDGYLTDLNTGNSGNERDRYFFRAQGMYEGDSLKLRLIADYDKIDEVCCGAINVQSSAATGAILLIGGQVTDPNNRFGDFTATNFDSTNEIENTGLSLSADYDISDSTTLTSITAFRRTNSLTDQDSDFTSADLIGGNEQDLEINSFTQEFRVSSQINDSINLLLGAFYINEDVDQTNAITYGQHFRPYANVLVNAGTGGALNIAGLEGTLGALAGNPALFSGQFFARGQGLFEAYTLDSEALSIFGQVDFDITDRLTLTLGGNYTWDGKDFTTDVNATGVFSSLDLIAFGNTAIFAQGLADQVGGALMLGRPATQAEIGAFAVGQPAIFNAIAGGVQAFADANDTNPNVNPFIALQPLQFLPPFLNAPNAVEDAKTRDTNFSYTIRLAYDVTDDVNVYASYATGFKASSINLSRDSRPVAGDAAALGAANLLQTNQTFGSRFAGPEEAEVLEAGIKGNWGDYTANFAVFRQKIDGFQSNVFTGTGFALANAGELETTGFEFEGTANPIEQLGLNLGVTYLDPEYVSFPASAIGDISGFTPAGIPEWTVTVGGQWTQPVGYDEIIARATYSYESDVQIVDGLPGFLAGGQAGAIAAAAPFRRQVDNVSASLTYAMENGLNLSIWGRNLLDDRYLLSLFDSVAQAGAISSYPNQPRTYGVSALYRF